MVNYTDNGKINCKLLYIFCNLINLFTFWFKSGIYLGKICYRSGLIQKLNKLIQSQNLNRIKELSYCHTIY